MENAHEPTFPAHTVLISPGLIIPVIFREFTSRERERERDPIATLAANLIFLSFPIIN